MTLDDKWLAYAAKEAVKHEREFESSLKRSEPVSLPEEVSMNHNSMLETLAKEDRPLYLLSEGVVKGRFPVRVMIDHTVQGIVSVSVDQRGLSWAGPLMKDLKRPKRIAKRIMRVKKRIIWIEFPN